MEFKNLTKEQYDQTLAEIGNLSDSDLKSIKDNPQLRAFLQIDPSTLPQAPSSTATSTPADQATTLKAAGEKMLQDSTGTNFDIVKTAENINAVGSSVVSGLTRIPETVAEDVISGGLAALSSMGFAKDLYKDFEAFKSESRAKDAAKAQIPVVQQIISQGGAGILEFIGAAAPIKGVATAVGLGAKAAGVVGETAAGAISGALGAKAGEKGDAALLSAAITLPLAYLSRIRPPTALEQAATQSKVRLTLGQRTGSDMLKSLENTLSATPGIGTSRAFKGQFNDLVKATENLTAEMALKAKVQPGSIFAKAGSSETLHLFENISDDALNTLAQMKKVSGAGFNQLSTSLSKVGPQNTTRIRTAASQAINELNATGGARIVGDKFLTALNEYTKLKPSTFSELHTQRQLVDSTINMARSLQTDDKLAVKVLTQVRNAITQTMKNTAETAGKGAFFNKLNTTYATKVAPLEELLFSAKDNSQTAFTIVNRALTSGDPNSRMLLKNLSPAGKEAAGYAIMQDMLGKSVKKSQQIDFKRLAALVRKNSSELGITLSSDHYNTIRGLEKIINSIDDYSLKLGGGNLDAIQARSLGINQGIIGAGAGAAVLTGNVGLALTSGAGIAITSKLLTNQMGLKIIQKAATMKNPELINLTRQLVESATVSSATRDLEEPK